MRVVVVGGGGRTGRLVVDQLVKDGHEAVATIRNPRQMADLVKAGAQVLMLDLVASGFDQWVQGLRGADAVIFAAGSSEGESSALDRKGTLRTVRAAEKAGVARYVSISAIGASTGMRLSGKWATDEMVDYYKQKRAANKLIRESDLKWTILEPGELTDGKGAGKATISLEQVKQATIARADVAAIAVAVLKQPRTIGQALQIVRGDSSIDTALAKAVGTAEAVPIRPAGKAAKPVADDPKPAAEIKSAAKKAAPAKKAATKATASKASTKPSAKKAPAKKPPAKKAQPAAKAAKRSSSKARSR
jgi:uncharacterized protein YbjT (DUF2867 family)